MLEFQHSSQTVEAARELCPEIWGMPPRQRSETSNSIDDPEVPRARNVYGHPLAGLRWKVKSEEVLLKIGWRKYRNPRNCDRSEGFSHCVAPHFFLLFFLFFS